MFFSFFELNYQGLNLNFVELALLLIDVDTESNPGSRQNDCKSSLRQPKKIKITSYSKVQNVFFNKMQPLSLNNVRPWSVTCSRIVESLQRMKFKVNSDINSKVSLCQGDIAKINGDAIVNATSETLISVGGITGAIHEAVGPGLLHECQKLNACGAGNVTPDYKLPTNYGLHTVRPTDKK